MRQATAPVWRRATTVNIVGGVLLAVVVLADIVVTPGDVVLTIFFPLASLLVAAFLGPRATAGFALAAVVLAAASALWNENQGAQYWVRLVEVVAVGVLAVLVAAIRTRREDDLRETRVIASAAQEALLPVLPHRIGPVEVATRYHSATREAQVGGDLFDFVAGGDRTRFILGDVSGKGVEAVAQAARVIRAFRQYGASEPDLLSVARRINDYVRPFWDPEFYATAVLVEIRDERTLTIVSAGHPPPLHQSGAAVSELPVYASVPLGVGPAEQMTEHPWHEGDRLLLYTDGLIEARDDAGAFLPQAQIHRALTTGDLDTSLDAVLDTVHAHAGGFYDDLALVLIANVGPLG